jgi:hypothetical protein
MMTAYYNARMSGDSHELALKTVVWTWCASRGNQDEMWYRWGRRQALIKSTNTEYDLYEYLSPGETEDDCELQHLVMLVLCAHSVGYKIGVPDDSKTSSQISEQIIKTSHDLRDKYKLL